MKKMSPIKKSLFIVFGLILLVAAAFNFRWVIEFGITPLVFGVVFIVLAIFAFYPIVTDKKLEDSIPNSLRNTAKAFLVFLLIYLLVAVGYFMTDNEFNLEDIAVVFLYGIVSLSVWGGVVFVVLVLPIWGLSNLINNKNK